jgi:hypothetical protein
MFFCPNCNNIADIARASTIQQTGGFTYYDDLDIEDSTTITNSTSSMTLTSSSIPSSKTLIISQTEQNSDFQDEQNSDSQFGGAISDIINKILKKETIDKNDVNNISINDLTQDKKYKSLPPKKKELVYNKIQDLLPIEQKKIMNDKPLKSEKENIAYFVCNNCGPIKKIEAGTLIYSKKSDSLSKNYNTGNYINMAYSKILARTRRYICPNDKCISHTDLTKREAIFFRKNNVYDVKYICEACKTVF